MKMLKFVFILLRDLSIMFSNRQQDFYYHELNIFLGEIMGLIFFLGKIMSLILLLTN